jgi:TPR repeat protein
MVSLSPHLAIGYEVSQSNSAFIIRRKLSDTLLERMIGMNLLLPPRTPSSPSLTSSSSSSLQTSRLSERLFVRQLLLSIQGGNSESAHLLGSYFLHHHPSDNEDKTSSLPTETRSNHEFPLDHLSERYPNRLHSAYYWYSKSSAMGNAFGSFQCGLIHHFGILNYPLNLQRAERYYQLALKQYQTQNPKNGGNHDQNLKMVCEGLLWLIHYSKKYSVVQSVSAVVGWGLRWMFFEG